MEALRRLAVAAALAGGVIIPAAQAFADQNVTVVYRNGERASGRYDGFNGGQFYLDVSATDERKIPIGDIALIDAVGGGQGLPETELREARGSQHLLLLRNGNAVKGQFVTIEGSDRNSTTLVFRAENGEERRMPFSDVGRLYLGNFPGQAPAGSPPSGSTSNEPPAASGVVRVAGNQKWVDSGVTVRQGQVVALQSSGEVTLSADNNDVANPPGARSGRKAAGAPVPDAPAGALIGRIGNGPAFALGDQTSVTMPESGRLYLSVNDDENSDNRGYFDVRINAGAVSRRR